MISVNFKVNGEAVSADVDEKMSLLSYLRDEMHLFGTKNGCGKAQCGACMVLIDGDAKRACTVRMNKVEGTSVETIEGLAKGGELHPVQLGFVHTGAIQCGFCTPGMIMAAKGLLDKNNNPTDDEIKQALKFNICRCTGYISIINAVKMAGKIMRGEEVEYLPETGGVGTSVVGKDIIAKAMGLPIYAEDREFPDMLYGRVKYTEQPEGFVKKIDTSKAEALEGVEMVLTAKDIPGRKFFGLMTPHQPVMVGEGEMLRYMGESVAVAFAKDVETAQAAIDLIEVEYEAGEGIYSIQDALEKEDRIRLHKDKERPSYTKVRRGDVESAFKDCDLIIEGEFSVPNVEHAYMEPESCVTVWDDEKKQIIVYMAHQGAYDARNMFAKTLDMDPEDIIMNSTPAGGGFGGKEEPTVHLHCAIGTVISKRPCKVVMTREESIKVSTKRHGEEMWMKYGCKKDGTFHAFEGRTDVECGAYDSLSGPVVFRSGVVMNGPYTVPFAKTDSIGHYTNTPPGGAFRGFGSTQVTFGAEILVDEMARALNMDPFEIRIKNALKEGVQGITGQTMQSGIGLIRSMEVVRDRLNEIKDDYKASAPNKKIGIGIASSYKNVGIGIGLHDGAGARAKLSEDGSILVKHGAMSLGQGPDTTMGLIFAEETGIPYDAFDVLNNITPECPDGEETTASRQTFVSGNAVKGVGALFLSEVKNRVSNAYGVKVESFTKEGIVLENKNMISFKEFVDKVGGFEVEYDYIPPQTSALADNNLPKPGDIPVNYKIHYSYTYATHAVIVEVDEETGDYEILKVIAAQDLGRAIHPLQSVGQIEGGVAMGVGYAKSEAFITDKGRIVTDNLAKLKLPKITDMPDTEVILVEVYQDEGPFGAKGMGELPVNPVAPAVSNAIFDAVGVRMRHLPITKEKVLEAIQNRD